VYVGLDKLSNFPLNSTRMQQAHYFRDINYYMLNIIVARKGVDIAPCPPPPLNTPLTAEMALVELTVWSGTQRSFTNRLVIIRRGLTFTDAYKNNDTFKF